MWLQWIIVISICVWTLALIIRTIFPPESVLSRLVRRRVEVSNELISLAAREAGGEPISTDIVDELDDLLEILSKEIDRRVRCLKY